MLNYFRLKIVVLIGPMLVRKFHISQISHRVKNGTKTPLLENVKFAFDQFDNFGGLTSQCAQISHLSHFEL